MKSTDLTTKLKEHFLLNPFITTKELAEMIAAFNSNISPNTISWKINQLKTDNLIFPAGRGLYTFNPKPEYVPELSLKTKRFYSRIKHLVSGDVSVWDTTQLFDLIGIQPTKHFIFLSVSKTETEPLFDKMIGFSKQIFLTPDKEIIKRYILPGDEAVIITTLVSEAPVVEVNGYPTLSLEGLLVDAWVKGEYYLKPMGIDLEELYRISFEKYRLNISKLLRYASRRDKKDEINELIKTFLQND